MLLRNALLAITLLLLPSLACTSDIAQQAAAIREKQRQEQEASDLAAKKRAEEYQKQLDDLQKTLIDLQQSMYTNQ